MDKSGRYAKLCLLSKQPKKHAYLNSGVCSKCNLERYFKTTVFVHSIDFESFSLSNRQIRKFSVHIIVLETFFPVIKNWGEDHVCLNVGVFENIHSF